MNPIFYNSQHLPDHPHSARIEEMVRKHHLAADELTEKQMAEAIRQAIACGDFKRLVVARTGAQCVIYLPYEKEQQQELRIKRLMEALEANGIPDPDLGEECVL